MKSKVLLNFFHPYPHRSRVGARLLKAARELPGIFINELYEKYPDFFIHVEKEQELLSEATLIIMQHPMYWYSGPSLMKEYIDSVYTEGFAYGTGGTALSGKYCLHVLSTGGPKEAYSPTGYNHFEIDTLLTPFEQTARLCKMRFLKPFVVHHSGALSAADIDEAAQSYRSLLSTYLAKVYAQEGLEDVSGKETGSYNNQQMEKEEGQEDADI